MNSYNTDIFFSNYYNLQSVHFEYICHLRTRSFRNTFPKVHTEHASAHGCQIYDI